LHFNIAGTARERVAGVLFKPSRRDGASTVTAAIALNDTCISKQYLF
jgi:hypothetical protein